MGTLCNINPVAAAVYFLLTAGIAMFSMNPFILAFSFFGAVIFCFVRNGYTQMKTHIFSLMLFIIMALINPLVNHNGATVIFVMNHNPVTLEALIYGIAASAMIISVLYWFRSFTDIMTSDKLLYIFGGLSPKLALIFSMALRFVPLFGKQIEKTEQAQKATGLYKDDNIADTFKGRTGVFGIIITWALENGIITADSMTARGYGVGKRTHFSIFRIRMRDIFFMLITVMLFILTLWGISAAEFSYFPEIRVSEMNLRVVTGFVSYGILVFLPTILEIKEALKWKYLKSKI